MSTGIATVYRRHAGLFKGAAASLVVIVVLLAASLMSVERPLAWLEARVEALGVWAPLLFGALFVALTVLLIPATPVTIAAGAVLGTLVGTVVILLAALTSSAIAFLLARRFAHDRIAAGLNRHPRLVRAVYRAAERGGWKVVVAVRLSHALPFGLQNYLFGLTPIGLGPFLAASAVAMLPGTAVYCYVGRLGAAALEAPGSAAGTGTWLVRGLGLLAAIAALAYVTHTAREIFQEEADVDLEEVKAAARE